MFRSWTNLIAYFQLWIIWQKMVLIFDNSKKNHYHLMILEWFSRAIDIVMPHMKMLRKNIIWTEFQALSTTLIETKSLPKKLWASLTNYLQYTCLCTFMCVRFGHKKGIRFCLWTVHCSHGTSVSRPDNCPVPGTGRTKISRDTAMTRNMAIARCP